MKRISSLLMLAALIGCTSSPKMDPVKAVVCDVEQSVTNAAGSLVVSQCAGTDAVACGNAFQAALGNANFCPMAGQQPLQTRGVLGAIVCPMAESAIMGFLTAQIPKECGCTKALDAGSLGALMVQACEQVVPL